MNVDQNAPMSLRADCVRVSLACKLCVVQNLERGNILVTTHYFEVLVVLSYNPNNYEWKIGSWLDPNNYEWKIGSWLDTGGLSVVPVNLPLAHRLFVVHQTEWYTCGTQPHVNSSTSYPDTRGQWTMWTAILRNQSLWRRPVTNLCSWVNLNEGAVVARF